ncbi:MAG: hypothetical protein Fur0022_32500 [Anaerolineales bacterium]
MYLKTFKLFLPIWVLILAALACGGSEPVTMDSLPVFDGAVILESGQSTVAEAVVEALKQTAGQEGVTAETRIYGVPAGTTWDAIKSFYASHLGEGWTEDAQLSEAQEGFNTAGWTRGGLASEQAVVAALVNDPFAGQDFLILVLFSE